MLATVLIVMIDRISSFGPFPGGESAAPARKVLRMAHNDRMAGGVPEWVMPVTPRQKSEEALSIVQTGGGAENFRSAMAYRQATERIESEPFGFGDLVDMINPIQHLPIIGQIYRRITGDTIKPASQIIGGAAFGGMAGAAGGIAQSILEYETGASAAGNAIKIVKTGALPEWKSSSSAGMGTAAQWPGTSIALASLSHGAMRLND